MSEEIISKEKLEERYKKVIIRTEETVTPFDGKTQKRYVVDLIHDGSIYYIHIEFSPYFWLCIGCQKEMKETYKDVLNKPLTAQ